MCVCIPPAAAPFLLPLLEGLLSALWALAPLIVPAFTVLLYVLFLTVRGLVVLVSWPVREYLERRSDRLWNEQVAAMHPREQLPAAGRRRVNVSVVRPQPAELEPAALRAIEAPQPQLMPPSIRIHATPREELTR